MTVLVVDALEVVDVEHHHRQRLVVACGGGHQLVHVAHECRAVEQLGERIELCLVALQRELAVALHDEKTDGGDHQFEKQHQAHGPCGQQAADGRVGGEGGRGPVTRKGQRQDDKQLHAGSDGDQQPARARRVGAHAVQHAQRVAGLQHGDDGLHAVEGLQILGQKHEGQHQRAEQRQQHGGAVARDVGALPKALQRNGERGHRGADQRLGGGLQFDHTELALQRKEHIGQPEQRGAQHGLRHALLPVLTPKHPHHPRDGEGGKGRHAERGQEIGL